MDVYNETFLTATPEPISFECTISPKSAGPPVKNSTGGGCVGAKMCSGGQRSCRASTSSAIPHRPSADELRANNTKIHLSKHYLHKKSYKQEAKGAKKGGDFCEPLSDNTCPDRMHSSTATREEYLARVGKVFFKKPPKD